MRRVCTEQEKRIISRNWRNICTGFAGKSAHSKIIDVFIILIVWSIVMFCSAICFAKIFNEFLIFIVWIIEFMIVQRFVNLGLFTIRVNGIKKNFLKKEQLHINGATVVDIKRTGFYVAYTYVEDHEYLFDKTPYGITVETLIGNVPDIKTGDRLLLLYGKEEQGEVSLQIMRMPPELEKDILQEQNEKRELSQNMEFLRCFPHPNATKIQKEKRMLEPEEKKKAEADFMKMEKRTLYRMTVMFAVVFFGCVNGITALLVWQGILDNGLQGNAFIIYLLIMVGGIAFLVFVWHALLKRSQKIATEIKYVQEILFKSIEVGEKGKTVSWFYEWDGMKYKEVKYEGINYRAEYGKVYIKYSGEKSMIVMVKK